MEEEVRREGWRGCEGGEEGWMCVWKREKACLLNAEDGGGGRVEGWSGWREGGRDVCMCACVKEADWNVDDQEV